MNRSERRRREKKAPKIFDNCVRIVNKTGLSNDTVIMLPDGKKLGGVFRVEVHPFEKDQNIRATLHVHVKSLDIIAEQEPTQEEVNG